ASTSAQNNEESAPVDESLRLALIDTSYDDGKISDSRRYTIEEAIIDKLVETPNNTGLFWNGSYVQGHRVYDCANERSMNFVRDVVIGMNMKEGKVKIIPWAEINSFREPRGRLWLPKPFFT
ncbi:DUF4780 domain-containing protein, partial [Streptomyces sp. IBSBF 2390]|uniref:DUF4780 domain-containing protein n=1 Tax=Streptomyces sp. IBSBF 2390 TaxID=2903533 RepID=UPI002FDC05DE